MKGEIGQGQMKTDDFATKQVLAASGNYWSTLSEYRELEKALEGKKRSGEVRWKVGLK